MNYEYESGGNIRCEANEGEEGVTFEFIFGHSILFNF